MTFYPLSFLWPQGFWVPLMWLKVSPLYSIITHKCIHLIITSQPITFKQTKTYYNVYLMRIGMLLVVWSPVALYSLSSLTAPQHHYPLFTYSNSVDVRGRETATVLFHCRHEPLNKWLLLTALSPSPTQSISNYLSLYTKLHKNTKHWSYVALKTYNCAPIFIIDHTSAYVNSIIP